VILAGGSGALNYTKAIFGCAAGESQWSMSEMQITLYQTRLKGLAAVTDCPLQGPTFPSN
jgi:hypothetical protein